MSFLDQPQKLTDNDRAVIVNVLKEDGEQAACRYIGAREECTMPEAVEFLMATEILDADPFEVAEKGDTEASDESNLAEGSEAQPEQSETGSDPEEKTDDSGASDEEQV